MPCATALNSTSALLPVTTFCFFISPCCKVSLHIGAITSGWSPNFHWTYLIYICEDFLKNSHFLKNRWGILVSCRLLQGNFSLNNVYANLFVSLQMQCRVLFVTSRLAFQLAFDIDLFTLDFWHLRGFFPVSQVYHLVCNLAWQFRLRGQEHTFAVKHWFYFLISLLPIIRSTAFVPNVLPQIRCLGISLVIQSHLHCLLSK